ncbi:MAG: hypothetical protein SCALA702_09650 [Melioribacteraceae bacterium]|nr:MAG: hypothetical protein SCALA702_09650 [Melioribacteraceae bacterium]
MLTSVLLIFFDIRIKFKLAYLFGALLPSLTDIFLYNLGIYSYNIFIALFTGILLGVFGFYYFYLGILNYYLEKKKE